MEIIHCSNEMEANHEAVVAVRKREVDILMKGKTKTKELLQLVLDEESGLCCGRVISDAFVFENPARPRENKLTIFTDGGINVKPNLKQKIEIVRNAVELSHLLGHPNPRVAILSADETVRAGLPSTLDAAILSKMNQRGQIRGCVIDGPLALDHAVSPEALHMKRIDSPIQGDADILIAPEIESANMLGKSATVWAGFRLGHVIVGALAPILIPSQADSTEAKLLFIALGCIICIL